MGDFWEYFNCDGYLEKQIQSAAAENNPTDKKLKM